MALPRQWTLLPKGHPVSKRHLLRFVCERVGCLFLLLLFRRFLAPGAGAVGENCPTNARSAGRNDSRRSGECIPIPEAQYGLRLLLGSLRRACAVSGLRRRDRRYSRRHSTQCTADFFQGSEGFFRGSDGRILGKSHKGCPSLRTFSELALESAFFPSKRWKSVILPMVLQFRKTMVLQQVEREGNGNPPHF